MEENTMMEETTMNTEVTPANTNYEPDTSSGSSTLAKVVIVGAVSAVAGAAAFGLKKLKAHNEKKTIEQLRKKGWTIEEPEKSEEVVEGEVISEEDILDEE